MLRPLPVALTWLLVGLCAAPARGEPTTALLPVNAPADLAADLPHQLPRQLLGPVALQARLAATPAVERAMTVARQALEHAQQHVLYMRRTKALNQVQRALAQLDRVAARHYAPRLVARVHIARALALLLRPANPQQALVAFGQALSADPSYRPDAERLPSRTARLLQQAEQSARFPSPPTTAEAVTLARLSGQTRLLWLGLRRSAGKLRVRAVLNDSAGRRALDTSELCPASAVASTVSSWLAPHLPSPVRAPRLSPSPAPRPSAPAASRPALVRAAATPPPKRGARPWYRRWWVWAVTGTVLAGAGVTAAVLATRTERRSYELHVRY